MAQIHIYGTTHCPYCRAAEQLLEARSIPFVYSDVTSDVELRMATSKRAGNYRSVPMIFINDQFIGGYQELEALERSGELETLLRISNSA